MLFLSQIQNGHFSHNEKMSDYCDAEDFKNHPLFSTKSNALQLILYYDDVEVCNPLGSRKTKHKLGMYTWYLIIFPIHKQRIFSGFFYYMLGNISPKYRSRVNSIQLLAVVKTKDLKAYTMNEVLSPIIADIVKLVSK